MNLSRIVGANCGLIGGNQALLSAVAIRVTIIHPYLQLFLHFLSNWEGK